MKQTPFCSPDTVLASLAFILSLQRDKFGKPRLHRHLMIGQMSMTIYCSSKVFQQELENR